MFYFSPYVEISYKNCKYKSELMNSLCNSSKISITLLLVIRSGFEPETYCLEGSCSIQLS